jgi:hypothetical protein
MRPEFSCAKAVDGGVIANAPISVMNSRRSIRSPRQRHLWPVHIITISRYRPADRTTFDVR